MKISIGMWQLMGFTVTSFFGTVLHFLYEWTGEALWIAPFSGVNESTWEHMKLLFWPTFVFSVIQGFLFRDREDFWQVKLNGMLLGLGLIPVIFYTYNGAVGRSPDWINIAIFFVAAAAAYIYEAKKLSSESIPCKNSRLALFALCAIALLFILFTFEAPKIGIFDDPLT